MQDNSDLIIRDCCEAEAAKFGKPDTICITVDVLREIVQRHFPGTCLHQIQEPAAAEQAAWHAGLDEGRAQATGSVSNATSQPAPAAVTATASPTFMTADQGRDWAWNNVREYVGTEGWTVMDSVNFHGFFLYGWNYRGQYELQRTATRTAVMQEILSAAPAAAAPVVLPEPDAAIKDVMGLIADLEREAADVGYGHGSQRLVNEKRAAIESKLHALLATATGLPAQAVPVANCYTNNEGDTWSDCPDDCDFVEGRALGEEFKLQASIRAWTEVFRVTKVPDETSDDYEVEPVSIRTTAAPQAQADARDAESDYQRGYRHGYNRRDAEVQGALL